VLAALYSYYLGSATVLSAVGAYEADPHQFQQLLCIDNPTDHHGSFFNHLFETHPPIEERIAALEKIASVQQT